MPWAWQNQGPMSVALGGNVGSVTSQAATTTWPRQEADYLRKRLTDDKNSKYDVTDMNDVQATAYLDKVTNNYKDEAAEALKMEFVEWLQGTHPANYEPEEYKNGDGKVCRRWVYQDNRSVAAGKMPSEPMDNWVSTSWGQKQLTHLPGVRDWLRGMKEKDIKSELSLNLLAEHGPTDLETAWIYFKTWVKGRPKTDAVNLHPGKPEAFKAVSRAPVLGKQPADMADVSKSDYDYAREMMKEAAAANQQRQLDQEVLLGEQVRAVDQVAVQMAIDNAAQMELQEALASDLPESPDALSAEAAALNRAVEQFADATNLAIDRQGREAMTDEMRGKENVTKATTAVVEYGDDEPEWLQDAAEAVSYRNSTASSRARTSPYTPASGSALSATRAIRQESSGGRASLDTINQSEISLIEQRTPPPNRLTLPPIEPRTPIIEGQVRSSLNPGQVQRQQYIYDTRAARAAGLQNNVYRKGAIQGM